jgi:hypothetical protein
MAGGMKEIKNCKSQKVVPIEGHRSKKQARDSLLNLLQDTRATARASENKTCLLCMAKKLCVNKTGLCAACYGRLNPREKQIADSEAAHKIITISVSDDRWPGNDKK